MKIVVQLYYNDEFVGDFGLILGLFENGGKYSCEAEEERTSRE